MTLRLLDSLSLPGDPAKPNEDAFGLDATAALVMDGATPLGDPLMPGPSDAAWIAQFGARRLLAHLRDGNIPAEALQFALADAEKSFAALRRHPVREKWQTPCASMMLVCDPLRPSLAVGGAKGPLDLSLLPPPGPATGTSPTSALGARGGGGPLEFLWYGDCAAVIAESANITLIGETLLKRGQEAARAKSWASVGPLTGPNRSGEMLARHRAGRNHINSGRHWLFSPDTRAASHVSRAARALKPGTLLLLASDGFLALVSDYGAYDVDGLMAAARVKGLARLGEELRAIEDADVAAEKYPRFKKSDDATALLMEIS